LRARLSRRGGRKRVEGVLGGMSDRVRPWINYHRLGSLERKAREEGVNKDLGGKGQH